MKIKITLAVIVASLTLLFAACGNSTNTTTTANTANKSNTAAAVNSNQAAATNNAAPATNNATNTVSSANTAAPTKDDARFKGEYMVGDVKCTVTPDELDLLHEIKCADKEKVQTYSRDDAPPKAIIVSPENPKIRFVFDDPYNLASGTFTDEKGKTIKVTRIQ